MSVSFSYKLLLIPFLALSLMACGGGESTSAPETSAPEAPAVPAVVELVIEGNDAMKFNKERLSVTEGQTVKLTLKHVGQLAKEAMGHNWILLAQGTNMADFAAKAVVAVDNGYIPADAGDQIVANTSLIGGGEEVTIEFEAPAPGVYDFICSFPGHFSLMQGKFVVLEK